MSCSSVHESRVVDLQMDARSVTERHDKVQTAADPIQFIAAASKPSHTSYLTNDR